MSQYIFGAGSIWGTPLVDAAGNAIANGTPVQLLTSQEIGMDESFESKKLYGQNQFPVDVGRGKGNLNVKAKFAQVNALAVSSLYFGQSLVAGLRSIKTDLIGTPIPTTPFTITVTPPNTGTFVNDLGVRDQNGLPMTKVASGPTTGQYSLSGAVYTFAAADTGKTVFISYSYSATTGTAVGAGTMTIKNLAMGAAPILRLDVFFQKNGKDFCTTYPNAMATKLGWQSKLDDYMVPEVEFDAFADAAGNVMYRSFSE